MISTTEALQALVERARQTGCVGLDTEFVWERTYYPRLGLIQLALSDEDCQLLDPLAIEDLSPLGELLGDPGIVKILHDAPQDLIILNRATGVVVENVFDTRIASGFAGLPATISLADLIKELLGIELTKTETRTDWLRRPLQPAQIDYALDDVRYLTALRVVLLARVAGPEIRDWLDQELAGLSTDELYEGVDDRRRYLKVKGSSSLDRRGLAVLREAAAWREQEARRLDRPRGHIVSDQDLVAVARQRPASLPGLHNLHLLSARTAGRHGEALVACVQRALALDDRRLPETNHKLRLSPAQKVAFETFMDYLERACRGRGIDPQLAGNHADFREMIRNRAGDRYAVSGKQGSGWRKILIDAYFDLNR